MDRFAEIRPYNDAEVRGVLDRLLANREFLGAVARLRFPCAAVRFPALFVPLVGRVMRTQLRDVQTVDGFQLVLESYMEAMIKRSTSGFTVSGLDRLEPGQPYLFLSNHRDIAMDPAFVNYALHLSGHQTVRIAIGDNLLTKGYASDLMRLNKSFIVKRSVQGPRQIFAALRLLSSYIRSSITKDRVPVWMAQREGRAKDGFDQTEPAIIKMLSMSQNRKTESFAEFIQGLRIVPVAISYEYDPLDEAKAKELWVKEHEGHYEKGAQEDVQSIARGISGQKGAVHVAFGTPLGKHCDSVEDVAVCVDRQIVENYVLHPSNYLAYRELFGGIPAEVYGGDQRSFVFDEQAEASNAFYARLELLPDELRPYVLRMYANCILRKQEFGVL